MPARDNIHEALRKALISDGWTITHDPYYVPVGNRKAFVDLGAERLIAAVKGTEKIAVEGKSFLGVSELTEFERALGQFNLYYLALLQSEPQRVLYLGIPEVFYNAFFDDPFFQEVIRYYSLKIIIFNEVNEEIVSWIK